MSATQELEERFRQIASIDAASGILHWDAATMLPEASAEARGEQLAALAEVGHEKITDPRLAEWFDKAEHEKLQDWQRANLAEMKARIGKLRRLPGNERIDQPLALLVGKCDAWLHLLGPESLQNPLANRALDQTAVDANSERIRKLLLEICPTVVANAETISQNLRYFPVSSFGHPPVRVATGDVVPDPKNIQPFMVEVPPVWILTQIAGEILEPPSA
jgi:hypothetical protein